MDLNGVEGGEEVQPTYILYKNVYPVSSSSSEVHHSNREIFSQT